MIENTFIIPTLNNLTRREEGSAGLLEAVESLYKFTPHNFKIIVIFNGTDADYVKAKELLGDKVHLWVKPHRNLGFGKSMNLGIRLADTEYVTLANDDVEVLYDTWWQETMALFAENPKLGGFNPHSFINKRHTGDRAVQFEIKDEYTPEDIAAMKQVFHNERYYSGLICTFFTICRKAMFDQIGLFDESFGLGSGEDYDLCVRATRAGYAMAGGSKVMVRHWWGGTKDNLPVDKNFTSNYDLIAAGNQHMTRKWGPHSDEVKRQLADGRLTVPQAEALGGGWPGGGPKEPLDKDLVKYPNKQWYQVVEL